VRAFVTFGKLKLFVTPQGQVAQLVERSPEKAGVGGSIPSLATTLNSEISNTYSPFNPTTA
jgi:hypothetical protein